MKGTLYLLPNLIGDLKDHHAQLPQVLDELVPQLKGLIAESEKGGRRYLSRFYGGKPVHQIPIALFTKQGDYDFLLEPLHQGEDWGVVSDAGLPCIADPGAELVKRARQTQIPVEAFSGPSSLFLALMLSGLPSQEFSFHGYLPRGEDERKKKLLELQKVAVTHVFIEAPYRNDQLLETLLETLPDQTTLSVAWNLTQPDQGVVTRSIQRWKVGRKPELHKQNAIYLIRT